MGKNADFIVLDRDLMSIDEKFILNVNVVSTFIDGKKVFDNGLLEVPEPIRNPNN